MEYENYFKEAFQKLNLLEQDFDITADVGKVDELKSFVADDKEAVIEEPVYDVKAENEEELEDEYIGKVILECECCHSKFYKDPDEIVIDPETSLANIEEECPLCNSSSGYTVIGKIEPFTMEEPTEEEVDMEVEDDVVDDVIEEPEEEEVEESLQDRIRRRNLTEEKENVCPHCGKEPCECEKVEEGKDCEDCDEPLEECGDKLSEGIFTKKPTAALLCYSEDDAFKPYITATSYAKNGAQAIKDYVNSHGGFEVKHGVSKKVISGDQALKYADSRELKNQSIDESLEEGIFDKKPVAAALAYSENNSFKPYIVATTYDKKNGLAKIRKMYNGKTDSNGVSTKVISGEEALKYADSKKLKNQSIDESLTEGIENLVLDTEDQHLEMQADDNGKVTVTTEPLVENEELAEEPAEEGEGEEVLDTDVEEIVPLDQEDVDEIEANSEAAQAEEEVPAEEPVEGEEEMAEEEPEEGEEDLEFDEFDEESFDEMGESYLRKVYDNVKGYKTTSLTESNNVLAVKGVITFDSGNTKETSFVFTEARHLKNGKIILEGYNNSVSKTKKAFSLRGDIENKKFISESLGYHYITKNLNESVKVSGRVKKILV